MKKILSIALLAGLIALTSACRKERMDDSNLQTVTTKTIYVELKANETYSTEIAHAGDQDDVMRITKQASHFLNSRVVPIPGGNVVFEYKPALNYTGQDEVQISNEEDSHGKGGHGNCSLGNHHDETITTVFKITVKGIATESAN